MKLSTAIPLSDEYLPSMVKLSDAQRSNLINRLCAALDQRFGISPNKQMSSKLERIFSGLELSELHKKVGELTSFSAEHPDWFALVAKLTVHETYFFRDEPQLAMLRNNFLPQLISNNSEDNLSSLRVLSAGCSTGEEVYSLAILAIDALLENNFAFGNTNTGIKIMPNWRVEIKGVDVSSDALKVAKKGCYVEEGLGSFRDMSSQWMGWFEGNEINHSSTSEIKVSRSPKDYVRNITNFEQHNLLQNGIHLGKFDLILCRNTMIYFNDDNKRTAQCHLLDMLNPNGVLILGATDPLQCPDRCKQHRCDGMAYYTIR